MELARQKEEDERLQEEVAWLAQAAVKDQELVPMYRSLVLVSFWHQDSRCPGRAFAAIPPITIIVKRFFFLFSFCKYNCKNNFILIVNIVFKYLLQFI